MDGEKFYYKRIYEYVCRRCKVKRKTRKFNDAKLMICNSCKKAIILAKEDSLQIKLWP